MDALKYITVDPYKHLNYKECMPYKSIKLTFLGIF